LKTNQIVSAGLKILLLEIIEKKAVILKPIKLVKPRISSKTQGIYLCFKISILDSYCLKVNLNQFLVDKNVILYIAGKNKK